MKTEATIRPVRPGDAEDLAPRLRPEDLAEVRAGGREALLTLQESLALSSRSFAVELGGELAALGGVVPAPTQTILGPPEPAVVWLLTGPAVAAHPIAFMRSSRRVIKALLSTHAILVNMVDARYSAALRWAARIGAEIHPPRPWGIRGEPFHLVVWRA